VRRQLRALGARLFRQRVVWLPTVWGALLLLACGAALALTFALHVDGWLAPRELAAGADGRGARTLVVEGWLEPSELDQAIETFRRGRYERVVVTGGPVPDWSDTGAWKTFADRAAAYLRSRGLTQVPVAPVPEPAVATDRTFRSAIEVGRWAERSGIRLDAIDVFSSGTHMLRSRMDFQLALGDAVEVGAWAATPEGYDQEHWWTTSAGAKAVLTETVSVAWTVCCFWPQRPRAGSEP